MSNSLKVGLMGLTAVGLVVIGYFLLQKSNATTPPPPATTTTAADQAASTDNSNIKPPVNNVSDKKTPPKKDDTSKTVDPNMPKTNMTFEKMEHDYGKVEQQTKNEYVFKFTNSGTNPLLIANAKGSCGCTVPEYPKEPIMPGEDGEIKVEYSSRTSKGSQTKTVTITANTVPEQTQLKISADVQPPAGDAATK